MSRQKKTCLLSKGYASRNKKQFEMGFTFKKWTDNTIEREILKIANQFDPPKMPSRAEIESMYENHGLSVAISKNGGFNYWAERLGLPQGYSETKVGVQAEKMIADELSAKGHEVELTTARHPYDILVDGCVKVDVKAANTTYIRGYTAHIYRLAKRQHTCDFYIFREIDTGITYIVPAHICYGQVQVGMGVDSKKYEPYKEAWELIGKAVDFYKSLII